LRHCTITIKGNTQDMVDITEHILAKGTNLTNNGESREMTKLEYWVISDHKKAGE